MVTIFEITLLLNCAFITKLKGKETSFHVGFTLIIRIDVIWISKPPSICYFILPLEFSKDGVIPSPFPWSISVVFEHLFLTPRYGIEKWFSHYKLILLRKTKKKSHVSFITSTEGHWIFILCNDSQFSFETQWSIPISSAHFIVTFHFCASALLASAKKKIEVCSKIKLHQSNDWNQIIELLLESIQ